VEPQTHSLTEPRARVVIRTCTCQQRLPSYTASAIVAPFSPKLVRSEQGRRGWEGTGVTSSKAAVIAYIVQYSGE
jgi:hypothetical protein